MHKAASSPTLNEKSQSEEDEYYRLISQANVEFNNSNYDECLSLLDQLELKEDNNSGQILKHNRAVVKFYKSGCIDHAVLFRELQELESNSSISSAITLYNKAVIYFHRHMYRNALDTLEPLVDKLETVEKHTALLIATLNLRLLLATNQLNRADAFISFLQSKIGLSLSHSVSTLDESSMIHDSYSRVEYSRSGSFQLLNMLTNVLCRKPIAIPEDGSAEYGSLKAHQYYIMKDFQMAAKQLLKISKESYQNDNNIAELNTCVENNMGVIHLRVRHYAIAAKFFQNALTFDKQIASILRQTALPNMSRAHSCEILYNLGISMLHLRRPKEAFQCFLVTLKFYHSNPRLWFRMSEACIMEHEMKLQEDEKLCPTVPYSQKSYSSGSQSAAVPEPTLEFAALCLRNALTLTNYYNSRFYSETEDDIESKSQSWHNLHDNNFCHPSKPIGKESLENMLAAIYAAYSFVSLRLGDHITALEMAKELLKSERSSDAHKMLAHMYSGEALIMLDKPAEARPHLEPTFVSSLNAFDFETKDWQVKSLDAAQNIVRYNLAVAMALQGDHETTKSLLSTLTHSIIALKALSLKLYIDGKTSK